MPALFRFQASIIIGSWLGNCDSSKVLLRVDLFHFSFNVVFIDLRCREVLCPVVFRGGYLNNIVQLALLH